VGTTLRSVETGKRSKKENLKITQKKKRSESLFLKTLISQPYFSIKNNKTLVIPPKKSKNDPFFNSAPSVILFSNRF